MSGSSPPNASSAPGAPPSSSSRPYRPYYRPDEQSDAAFVATAPRFSTAPVHSSAADRTSSISGTARLSYPSSSSPAAAAIASSPPNNRYLKYHDVDLDGVGRHHALHGGGGGGIADMARALLVSGAFQYASTCAAMPFEVGKLLLQIQWVPKDEVWEAFTLHQGILDDESGRELQRIRGATSSSSRSRRRRRGVGFDDDDDHDDDDDDDDNDDNDDGVYAPTSELPPEAEEWQDEHARRDYAADSYELSDEEDAEALFRDISSQTSSSAQRRATPPASVRRAGAYPSRARPPRRQPTDGGGYVMRRSVHEDGTRPEFVMPVVVQGGVWEMIRAVARGKEGWAGLWKGALTTFLLDVTGSALQPLFSTLFSFVSPSALSPLPLPYAPYPRKTLALLVASHVATGLVLSPLDLVRTRLVAQSTLPPHRKYRGPLDALRTILREEGGWRTAYLHPNLLIPALLDCTLRPLLSLGAPLLIELRWRVDPNARPVTYALAELVVSTAALLVTLPVETVRRRLQIQARAPWGSAPAAVHGSRPSASRQLQQSAAGAAGRRVSDGPFGSSSGGGGGGVAAASRGGAGVAAESPTTTTTTRRAGGARSAAALVVGATPLVSSSTTTMATRPLRTCVETRPRPYVGVLEAMYRILTEETSVAPRPPGEGGGGGDGATSSGRKPRRASRGSDPGSGAGGSGERGETGTTAASGDARSSSSSSSSLLPPLSLGGIRSLYRGMGMGVGANATVFVLTLLTGERAGSQAGWAEI